MKSGWAFAGPGCDAIISPASFRRLFLMYIDICKSELRLFIYKIITIMHEEVKKLQKIAGILKEGDDIDLSDTPQFRDPRTDKERKIMRMPKVSFEFGKRIKRGGYGVKGTYDELKDRLSRSSRENTDGLMDRLGITWNEMIIYHPTFNDIHLGKRVSTNKLFAILGTDGSGKQYMYDRAGHGGGAYSKLYSLGGTRVFASAALNMTPQDFKEDRETL